MRKSETMVIQATPNIPKSTEQQIPQSNMSGIKQRIEDKLIDYTVAAGMAAGTAVAYAYGPTYERLTASSNTAFWLPMQALTAYSSRNMPASFYLMSEMANQYAAHQFLLDKDRDTGYKYAAQDILYNTATTAAMYGGNVLSATAAGLSFLKARFRAAERPGKFDQTKLEVIFSNYHPGNYDKDRLIQAGMFNEAIEML
jgi:hypothetical protein